MQDRFTEHFILETTARTAACLVSTHRDSAAFYFHGLRELTKCGQETESKAIFGGEIEIYANYFGGRQTGNGGRGATENPCILSDSSSFTRATRIPYKSILLSPTGASNFTFAL